MNTLDKKRLSNESKTIGEAEDALKAHKEKTFQNKIKVLKSSDMELAADVEGMYKDITKAASAGNEKKYKQLMNKLNSKFQSASETAKGATLFKRTGVNRLSQKAKEIREEADSPGIYSDVLKRNKGGIAKKKTKKKKPRGVGIASRGYGKAMK
tara:strand:+ start:8620 stop:9081 length:462 start_codon:yes stop_codon:yes gene_type:complete